MEQKIRLPKTYHFWDYIYLYIKTLSITSDGIWFFHKLNSVMWVYPWKRKKLEAKYISLLGYTFNNLKDLSIFYDKYLKEISNEVDKELNIGVSNAEEEVTKIIEKD